MSTPVSKYLEKTSSLSEKELQLLDDELEFKTLEKGEFLLKEGEVCSFFGFINTGALYQHKVDNDNNSIIIDLNIPKDWVINHTSFTLRKPSEYHIQAFEKTTIYILSITAIHNLIAKSQSFFQIGKVLEASVSRIHFYDNNNTPDEKYHYLLKNQPEILQKFPQHMIASYLKITPETLSRVKRRILKS